MIEVSVMYPKSEGAVFNIDYYNNKHVPMVIELHGDDLKSGVGDSGIARGVLPKKLQPILPWGIQHLNRLKPFKIQLAPKLKKYSRICQISPILSLR